MKIKQVLGGLMAMATLTTCAFAAVGCSTDSAQGAPIEQTQTGGMVISEGKSNGVSLMATTISAEDYEEYGVVATAESAFQITATVRNKDGSIATGAKIDWSVAWEDGETDVTEITVTPTSDGAWTANVACLEGYSVPIIIMASVREKVSLKATCRCEYARKVTGVAVEIGGVSPTVENVFYNVSDVSTGSAAKNAVVSRSNTYTIDSEYTTSFEISFEQNIYDALADLGESVASPEQYYGLYYTGNFVGNLLNLGHVEAEEAFEAGEYDEVIKAAFRTLGVGTKIATIKVTIDFNGYAAKYEGMFEDLTYYYDVLISEQFYETSIASIELSDSELYF